MSGDGKLMEMLTGYAASHQHPFNIFVHMIGIPTIMLGRPDSADLARDRDRWLSRSISHTSR